MHVLANCTADATSIPRTNDTETKCNSSLLQLWAHFMSVAEVRTDLDEPSARQ